MSALQFDTPELLCEFIENLPIISDDDTVQAFYIEMRLDGQSHYFAEMCAHRRPPGTQHTDQSFQKIGQSLGKMPEMIRRQRLMIYERMMGKGRKPPEGYLYMSQMARFPGDPRAWVADVGELKSRCKEDGSGIEELGIKAVEKAPRPKVVMDDDLVNRYVRKAVADPVNAGKNVQTIKHEVIEKHAYNGS